MTVKQLTGWILAGLLIGAATARGQSIRILDKAVVAGPEVRLGEIATIDGADKSTAEALAQTVLLASIDTRASIRSEDVLFAVIGQNGAQFAAKLQVRGSTACAVTVEGGAGKAETKVEAKSAGPLTANQPLAVETAPGTATVVMAVPAGAVKQAVPAAKGSGETLARLLTAQVAEQLGVATSDLRISFETANPLVEQSVTGGQRWIIKPLTHSYVGLVQWEAQLVDGAKTSSRLTVQARVERRMQVAVAAAPLVKGRPLSADQIKIENRWIDRVLPTVMTSADEALDMTPIRNVTVGAMLDQRDFRATTVVAKDQVIDCVFISGGLKIGFKGKTLAAGQVNDSIAVRNEANGEKFEGTLASPRLVVIGGESQAKDKPEVRAEAKPDAKSRNKS